MGYEGQKIRVYRIDTHHWGKLHAILERRLAKREDLAEVEGNTLERYPPIPIAGSPTALDLDLIGAGDPTQHFPSAAAPLVAQPSLLDLDRNALLHPPQPSYRLHCISSVELLVTVTSWSNPLPHMPLFR